ncbi:PA0069 family radical SAM protein [Blastopirellula marina]|uniref:Radical SAM protein n=1 Tax=Blastopirellula marina TaxID=124 RepID=A0A2S8G1T8_9BACT|nr:PA0069 family radical SAM protein [Blastopirellula marina]PQO38409.1 radical SAM protein [Blastopirellula marina]PTL45066.1 radical SAM protein [Blastopirellula marina]
MEQTRKAIGRGTSENPTNRFELLSVAQDLEHLDPSDAEEFASRKVPTEYFADITQSLVTKNDSPDISFTYSLNPYRGCAHGCSYCYARPYHEYLGFSSGLDFETKIMVKREAPRLFREFLKKRSWQCEVIAMSGVTDCYQPAERQFEVTRGCLEVALESRQPLGIITKNALILRDIDLLAEMAKRKLVCANISVTSLDQKLTRVMEPRTSSPAARLNAIEKLTAAGVPVNVMVAPIIPGLNDAEIPAILQAVAERGAVGAGYTLLRLPHAVKEIFTTWLDEQLPEHAQRVRSRVEACRGGQLYDSAWGSRMRGEGIIAETIAKSFAVFREKHGLTQHKVTLDTSSFRVPDQHGKAQLRMF